MNADTIKALKIQLVDQHAAAVKAGKLPVILRAQVDAGELCDPLAWLAVQQGYPKFYWRDQDNSYEIAYAGAAQSFSFSDRSLGMEEWKIIRQFMAKEPRLRCWSFGAFYSKLNAQEWSDFDAWSLHIPKIGLERSSPSGRYDVVCQWVLLKPNDPLFEAFLESLDRVLDAGQLIEAHPRILSREESFLYDEWSKAVGKALRFIENGIMTKVVLARRVRLLMDQSPKPEGLMKRLMTQSGHAFFCSMEEDSAFLGVSPELLYQRYGSRIDAYAVAGTRPRGKNDQHDLALRQELAASLKDQREHEQVVDMLSDKLRSLCELDAQQQPAGMVELSNQRHLFQRLHGRLLEGVTDEAIINALHPTPAVGGVPTEMAMGFVSSTEPFDRGLFAGNIGWLSRDAVQMAVGIRCCLLRQAECFIYGGAGIVEGSNALAEWQEIELKMKNIMDIFNER